MMTNNCTQTSAAAALPLELKQLSVHCIGSPEVAMHIRDKFERQMRCRTEAVPIAHAPQALKGAARLVATPPLQRLAAQSESLARSDQLALIVDARSSLMWEVDQCIAGLPVARKVLQSGAPECAVGKDAER